MKRTHVFSINEAVYRAKLDIDVTKSAILDVEDLRIWNKEDEDWEGLQSMEQFDQVRKKVLGTPNIYYFG